MTILFYSRAPVSPYAGGIGRITYTLGTELKHHGYGIYYVSEQKYEHKRLDIPQYYLPNRVVNSKENSIFLSNLIQSLHVDIVVNQFALNGDAVRLINSCKCNSSFKLVSCFHNSILTPIKNMAFQKEFIFHQKGLDFLVKALESKTASILLKFIYKKKHKHHYLDAVTGSDACVSLCAGLQDELQELLGDNCFENLYIIPNCIELPDNLDNNSPKENEVLWVGSFFLDVKRPDIVLTTWRHLQDKHPDWSLRLLGTGPGEDCMINYSKSLGLKNVFFEGRVRPDLYYKKAKILCVTSSHESFSLVTVEAKSFNVVPLVMNTFPAAPMIVNDNVDGLLVPPMDTEEFSRKLDYLMTNTDVLQRLSSKCYEGAKRFDSKIVVGEWMSLFNDIMSA